ncbi:unnamed protein product [Staurois parvus]|uniref:Uncharacterized protein n=1 Tax=Staurois parvus TaxID=386267 RepID=A0ABN9DKL2_9NEOB|nr:unnamed protein product [Staurois parvus]
MDLLQRKQPTTLQFAELLRATHSFTNVCICSLYAFVLDFIHVWPWGDWNT